MYPGLGTKVSNVFSQASSGELNKGLLTDIASLGYISTVFESRASDLE